MKKHMLKWIALTAALMLLLAACGGGDAPAPAEEPAVEEVEEEVMEEEEAPAEEEMEEEEMAEEEMGEVVTIEFWHAMGGELGEVVDELVARFNDSQSDIVVNSTFQGSYDDTYNALLAAFETGTEPNLVQNFDLASQTMIDTGRLIPAYQLMEADGFDSSVFLPAVSDYYSDDNGMVALAFNSSTPIAYYNTAMFEAAGVEPPAEGESWTFSEFTAACDAIQASGVESCIALGQVGWFFEQILANSGGMYYDNNNGRTGRATTASFNEGVAVEVFDFLSGLVADGYSPNLGSTWSDTDAVFFAEEAAIIFDSTSGVRGFQDGAGFDVGTMFMPYADSADGRNGVIIGGAALWLIDDEEAAQDAAAWEFMKFMAGEDQQVTWHTGTGYFPVRTDISGNSNLQTFWTENPNFVTAIDQLEKTNTTMADGSPNYAVLGGRAGPAPAIRRFIVEAYSAVLDDGLTAQEALDIAAEKADQELADYNAFFGVEAPTEAEAASEEDVAAVVAEMAEGATELQFWHAMGGELGEVVEELVNRFNSSQSEIFVTSTFQGSYDDTYNALLAAFETGTEPNIIQNFDLASQTMIDTGRLVPAHELMAADGFDSSVFLPAVADYYSDDEGMVALAFNSSTPIAFYNTAMFEAAGVEPPAEGESWTFSEFKVACDAIQASGVENCIALGQVGWFFEQILANSGGMYYDNNNGRTGRAQEVMFNQGVAVEVFDFLSGLVAEGYSPNLGSTWSDTDAVFFAEEAAIIFDSTSGARGFQDGAGFDVGTMFMPYADSADGRNGVIIGGAALWLLDSGDGDLNDASWQFMKYMAQENQQVTWHTGTGYFPVRTDISGNSDLQAFWTENPNFVTAIDQLETTNTVLADGSPNYAVLGGRAGPAPAIRRFIVEAYSAVLDDGLSAQEALDIAAEKANQELADYNAFFE
ncbi:MAG: ABC transporter substrate-binding protein [Anaerolineae bacterium]